jgi:hypothetical protein
MRLARTGLETKGHALPLDEMAPDDPAEVLMVVACAIQHHDER